MKSPLITTAVLALSAALLAPQAAQAQLNVNAVRATVTPPGELAQIDFNTGAQAQISSTNGGALASTITTRTAIGTVTFGNGGLQAGPRSAAGESLTPYALWNTGQNRALTVLEASGLGLSFNFVATGYTVFTTATPDGGRGVSFSATVVSDIARAYQDEFAQFCGVNCSSSGSAALGGAVGAPAVTAFSLQHQDWPAGSLAIGLGSFSTGEAESSYALNLQSVTLTSGTAPTGGLDLRFLTGEDVANNPVMTVFVVSAVPEPGAAALMLAGLLLLGGRASWRRPARAA